MDTSDKNKQKFFPEREPDDLSTHGHRQLIGYIGMFLPLLLWLLAGWRPTGEPLWAPLGSVSAYYYSGAVSVFAGMLICIAWAVYASFRHAPIFWPEVLALEFFAFSWLVKGRADVTAAAAARKMIYYARHPEQLVKTVRKTVSSQPGAGQTA